VRKLADEFVAIFPHELPVYEAAGAKISFVGNPLVDAVRPEMPRERAREFFQIPADKTAYPAAAGQPQTGNRVTASGYAAGEPGQLLAERADTVFLLPVADGINEARIQSLIDAAGVPVTLTHEYRYALMAAADAAVAYVWYRGYGSSSAGAALCGTLPLVAGFLFCGETVGPCERISACRNILLDESFETELLPG
jgi:lipid-A-disaccharide synthase